MRLATAEERKSAPAKAHRRFDDGTRSHRIGMTNPFRWVGAVGYYYDEEVGTYYVRARNYDATMARWLSRDPLFYPMTGACVHLYAYVLNRPGNLVDPTGLIWTPIGGDRWRASGGEDSLMGLAYQITGDNDDWVCIWPTKGNWNGYPWASCNAEADVSNLTARSGRQLLMRQAYPTPSMPNPDNFMIGVDRVFGRGESVWATGVDAATQIKSASREGGSPIYRLVLGGHCFADAAIGSDQTAFSSAHIFAVATEKDNTTNTYASASAKIGPPKCWFTRTATLYGFACNTATTWAPDWAGSIARRGATVYGAPHLVGARWLGRGRVGSGAWLNRDAEGTPGRIHTSVRTLRRDPLWVPFEGTQ